MDVYNIYELLQNLNQIFIGITISSLKLEIEKNPGKNLSPLSEWEEILEKDLYYLLNRSDTD